MCWIKLFHYFAYIFFLRLSKNYEISVIKKQNKLSGGKNHVKQRLDDEVMVKTGCKLMASPSLEGLVGLAWTEQEPGCFFQ